MWCKAFSDIKLSFLKFRNNVSEKILKHLLIKTCHSIQNSPNKILSLWTVRAEIYFHFHTINTMAYAQWVIIHLVSYFKSENINIKNATLNWYVILDLSGSRLPKGLYELNIFNLGANFTKVTTKTKRSQPPTSTKLPSLQARRKTSTLVGDQMHLLGLRVLSICMTRTPRYVLFTGIVLGEARPIHSWLGMWTRHMWLV